MALPLGTYGIQFIAELTRLLPERVAHPYLFQALNVIVDEFEEGDVAGELMVRYEVGAIDRTWFWPRSGALRCNRAYRRSRLCFAQIGPGGLCGSGQALS